MLLYHIFNTIIWVINIYSYVLLAYVLMSWLPGAYESKLGEILAKLAEPYLGIFRKIIPPFNNIDFSPILAFIVLNQVIPRILAMIFRALTGY